LRGSLAIPLLTDTGGGYSSYTYVGYHSRAGIRVTPETKKSLKGRLARVEGQVRGLAQMVEQDRYCIDVVTQVRAARAALAKVEQLILSDHLGSCVEAAIVSGDPTQQRAKVAELIDVLGRRDR
jgi:CsoR family transcriptional regulator, copper-sensing transcriptional repressor